MKRLAVFVLLLLSPAWGETGDLAGRIAFLLSESPAARRATWGVQIADLETGEILCDLNSEKLFVPASNTKLFSTALGLMRLGPDHRFETRVVAEKAPDARGRVAGDLVLVGGGDPNLSARPIPYRIEDGTGNPLQPIEDLADQIVARGVRRIEGDVIGDDTAYVRAPYPEGWAIGDALWEYGAPVSALTLHDNTFALSIRPGARLGDPAIIVSRPPVPFYRIENRARTRDGGERKLWIDREPGSRELRVWGTIPRGDSGERHLVAIAEPALYAAQALHSALARRGVAILGKARARHALAMDFDDLERGQPRPQPKGVELAKRISPPLLESLRIINKVSQNLHAELMLLEVGRVRRNIGSREAGLAEMQAFLSEAGIDREEFDWSDGSGLSRLNLVSPRAIVRLLRFVYDGPQRENWLGLMPVGGEDGTLRLRFDGAPARGRILAKTGTLSHVSALSGYVMRPAGGPLAFSILVNNYGGPAWAIRAAIDKICDWMVE
ncbi:MAG: D-alanyl-D-alanine carboxypeptidase/D-alanyl-D-alanine-endopeptidase [Bryobacteraceae bacterium]